MFLAISYWGTLAETIFQGHTEIALTLKVYCTWRDRKTCTKNIGLEQINGTSVF